jgi:serine/threonine-protein kinase
VANELSSDGVPEEQPMPLSVGAVLDGRFLVERVLGAGGMGYVVLARHVDLEERVAIKLLLPGRADEDARRRLVREARAAVKIKSDHVVRILDVVSTGPHAPYIVMEYLEGEDLAQRLERTGPLDVREASEIVLEACEVVGEAHVRGMVHRDIKPSNLFLVRKPAQPRFVKVLDFGISKALDGGAERLTASNSLLGSPAYASPEQLRDARSVDRRCDVWGLGAVLYELLTGKLPFPGGSIAEVCARILEEPPARPPAAGPMPQACWSIIERCLEKDPGRRYDNLAELAGALRQFSPRAADKSLGYLAALGAKLPELPKSPTPSSVVVNDTVLTAQGQTFDTKTEGSKRRPVAFAILGLSAAVGVAMFYSAKARLPEEPVASERSAPVVAVASTAPTIASGANPSVEAQQAPSVTPALSASLAPSAVASAPPSAGSSQTPNAPPRRIQSAPRPPKPRPAKSSGNETTTGAPWVDSR